MKKKYKSLKIYMIFELIIFIVVTLIIAIAFSVVFINSELAGTLDYDNAPYQTNKKMFEAEAFDEINIEEELGKNAFFQVYQGTELIYSSKKGNKNKKIESIPIDYIRWIPSVEVVTIKLEKLRNGQVFMSHFTYEDALLNYYVIENDRVMYGMEPNISMAVDSEKINLLNGYYKKFKLRRVTLGNGQIVVFFTPNFVLDNEATISKQIATISLALLCIIIISTMLYLSRINGRITKPLKKLQELIDQFEVGEVAEEDFLKGPREFVYIVNKFNKMSLKTLELQKEKELSYLNKRRFLSEISHDLKTPMTIIKSYAEALSSDLLNFDEKKQYLTTIVDKIGELSSKIDEFYFYNKLESPDLPLTLSKVDIFEYVRSYIISIYDDIISLGCELDINIPDEHAYVDADASLIDRVLENILFNSVQHNQSSVNIQVSVYKDKGDIVVAFRDNGKGIPEGIISDIFKPYVTGDLCKTFNRGSGLGLAIAQRIVEKHGWQIVASVLLDSVYNIEFCIRIPINSVVLKETQL